MSLLQEQYPGFLSKSTIAWQGVSPEQKSSPNSLAQSPPDSNIQSPAGSAAQSPSASSVTVAHQASSVALAGHSQGTSESVMAKLPRQGSTVTIKTLLGKFRGVSVDRGREKKDKDVVKSESEKTSRSSSRRGRKCALVRNLSCRSGVSDS